MVSGRSRGRNNRGHGGKGIRFQAAAAARTRRKKKRIIPTPTKIGGFLPLIPIFAGLSALGALATGASSIAKAVKDSKASTQQLKERERHNKVMEVIAAGKGLHLKPYKEGRGLRRKKKRTTQRR